MMSAIFFMSGLGFLTPTMELSFSVPTFMIPTSLLAKPQICFRNLSSHCLFYSSFCFSNGSPMMCGVTASLFSIVADERHKTAIETADPLHEEDDEEDDEEGKGLSALFDYRHLLLKVFMKPKSAAPFLFDAHSIRTGSSV